jgi:hypothetical protein
MPLDEREKRELEERIRNQRRAMWKGEVKDKTQAKKKLRRTKASPVLRDPQRDEEARQILEKRLGTEKEETAGIVTKSRRSLGRHSARNGSKVVQSDDRLRSMPEDRRAYEEIERVPAKQQEREKTELERKIKEQRRSVWNGRTGTELERRKGRETPSRIPSLKLALIVIISLIGAVMIGIAIGYLAAVRDLINI